MSDNTQRQLQLQEKLETLTEAIVYAVEELEAQGISYIVSNDFEALTPIIEKLTAISGMVVSTIV